MGKRSRIKAARATATPEGVLPEYGLTRKQVRRIGRQLGVLPEYRAPSPRQPSEAVGDARLPPDVLADLRRALR